MLTDRQSSQATPASMLSIDGLTNSVSEFSHDPENGVRFKSCRTIASLSLRVTSEDTSQQQRMYTTVLINGQVVRVQLDTVSDATIISETEWRSIGSSPLRNTSEKAINACGGYILKANLNLHLFDIQ
ncbi:unnamed protein product [Mesocestoides corti]|uniref:Peptidase A2 domain-containing protein n=1 Tax=Mesocestoides corti TaxID=53468 RepID=A0A0R3U7G5_MESCO|nr:unnamed protein product [Mesocestoides corti]